MTTAKPANINLGKTPEMIPFTAIDGTVVCLPANLTIEDLVKMGIKIHVQEPDAPLHPKPHYYHPAP